MRADFLGLCRIQIRLAHGQRRDLCLGTGDSFIIVNRIRRVVRQYTDTHAVAVAVTADTAATVECRGLQRQGGPAGLDAVIQNFMRLGGGIHPYVKAEGAYLADGNFIIRIGGIPFEDGTVRPQSCGINHIRRIGTGQIADIGQIGTDQIIQDLQVIRCGTAGIGGGDGNGEHITGITVGHGKGLGQRNLRFPHHQIDLAVIQRYGVEPASLM